MKSHSLTLTTILSKFYTRKVPLTLTITCRIELWIQWWVLGELSDPLPLWISWSPEALLFWAWEVKCLGSTIVKLSISPRRQPHHRTARARSILIQSTRFHLQISSQLLSKHGCMIGINEIPPSIVYCLSNLRVVNCHCFSTQIRCVDVRIHIQAQVSSQNDAVLLHRITICLYDVSSSPKRSVGGWLLCVVVANVALDQMFISSLNCTETILSSQLQNCIADHLLSIMHINNQMR